jgi:RHS repeat-associated protein
VKPLDLARPPTTEELSAAGQLGGPLHATHALRDARREARSNHAFAKAIQAWNNHDYARGAKLFAEHVAKDPESPWASEAVLHTGCFAHYQGRYADAEHSFQWIMARNAGKEHPGARALVNKARLRLGLVRVSQDRFEDARDLFRQLREEGHDWRHRTYASHWIQRLNRYDRDRLALRTCGTRALAYLLEKRGKVDAAREVANLSPESLDGNSMETLAAIAARYEQDLVAVKLSLEEVSRLSLPALLYVDGEGRGERGHFRVLDRIEEPEVELLDPQSGERFRQSLEQLVKEWGGIALVFAEGKTPPGTRITRLEMGRLFGGCCGVARPPDNMGDPGKNAGPGGSEDYFCGTPSWSVNMINMNLHVTDVPLWYQNPIGPSVNIMISYNSQSSISYHEPFGNKWQFNYASYLVVDPSDTVTLFMPDGRIDTFKPDGSGGYRRPYQVFNELTKIGDNWFELRFPGDTVYVYKIPAGTGAMQPYLVTIRDAHGQSLTLGYNANVQLTSITDAMGRVTTLTYNGEGLVTSVADPFGRSAAFQYDDDRNLVQITDMGGYWSKLSYDADVYLTGLENARGKWNFTIEPADGNNNGMDHYPPPGGMTWEDYRITVTDPSGHKSEYYYEGYSGYSWYVSPRYYVSYVNGVVNNYTMAHKTEYHFTSLSQNNEISSIRYPDNGLVTFGYDDKGNLTSIRDPNYHTTRWTYNDMGRVTSVTNPKGVVSEFHYASNGVDLTEIKNGLGSVVMGYNGTHDVVSFQDRAKNPAWVFRYNSYGQLTSMTDPQGIATTYAYNAGHQIIKIKTDGSTTGTFTYDTIGRVASHTDATGLTLKYQYNGLNHIKKIIYPDAKSVGYTYAGCCPRLVEAITDRAGRTNHYEYDDLQRLSKIIDPAGGTTTFLYDENGNLVTLVDANGNATVFDYDLNGRLVRRTYADGQSVRFTHDAAGLLTSRTNGRGITTTYGYDDADNLMTMSYSDDTPGVTYVHDDYDRMVQRHDGTGAYHFDYDPDSRLKSVDGPWANDTVTYAYDSLGRRKALAVQGGQSVSYVYDRLGRLGKIQVGGGAYQYGYAGVSPLVDTLTRPNGSKTKYQYDLLNRLQLISNRNGAGQIITEYAYTYNAQDLRASETRTDGAPAPSLQNGFTLYDHNRLNQVTQSTNPDQVFLYDDDGNMIQGYTPEGYPFTATYDAENRLDTIAYRDPGAGNVLRLTQYAYRGDGMLAGVKRYANGVLSGDTRYVRDGLLALQERNGSNVAEREYAWGLGMGGGIGGLLRLRQAAEDYAYLYDGRGNVSGLLDKSQALVASYVYSAFGRILFGSATIDQPFLYSTKEYTEKTGLSYFGYRFYSSGLGRWLSRDPIQELDGLNLYVFVLNNPINMIDLLGLDANVMVSGSNVTIEIPINYSGEGATQDVIDKFSRGIERYWTGTFGRYNVTTIVRVGNTNEICVPRGQGRAEVRNSNRGTWPSERPEWTAAHEAGHLMRLSDKYTESAGRTRPVTGWEGDIMAEHGGRPSERDIQDIIQKNR